MDKIRLNRLTLNSKPVIERFLKKAPHNLSPYHFANIFIWKTLFKINWAKINGQLCIFFKDRLGCFMYLPPLGRAPKKRTLDACFKIMDGVNSNPEVSRIENIEKGDLGQFERLGYKYYSKPGDYFYLRRKICGLKGNPYKSQRWAYNYFMRNTNAEFSRFENKDKKTALKLCLEWKDIRKNTSSEKLYQWMIEDNYLAQKQAIKNFNKIGLQGYKIKVNGKLRAYSLGFRLNKQTFCILCETCDLSYKGISVFIFRGFSKMLTGYRYVNVMDDSGLERLRKIKLAYHPQGMIENYVIAR